MKPLVIIADDLSGAAESAAGFLLRSSGISLRLGPGAPDGSGVTVFDLHSRRSDPARASRDVRSVLQSSDGSEIVKKIDSLLRGNIAAEVGELSRDGSRGHRRRRTAQARAHGARRRGVGRWGCVALHRPVARGVEAGSSVDC